MPTDVVIHDGDGGSHDFILIRRTSNSWQPVSFHYPGSYYQVSLHVKLSGMLGKKTPSTILEETTIALDRLDVI